MYTLFKYYVFSIFNIRILNYANIRNFEEQRVNASFVENQCNLRLGMHYMSYDILWMLKPNTHHFALKSAHVQSGPPTKLTVVSPGCTVPRLEFLGLQLTSSNIPRCVHFTALHFAVLATRLIFMYLTAFYMNTRCGTSLKSSNFYESTNLFNERRNWRLRIRAMNICLGTIDSGHLESNFALNAPILVECTRGTTNFIISRIAHIKTRERKTDRAVAISIGQCHLTAVGGVKFFISRTSVAPP